jgi:hypothetical protein
MRLPHAGLSNRSGKPWHVRTAGLWGPPSRLGLLGGDIPIWLRPCSQLWRQGEVSALCLEQPTHGKGPTLVGDLEVSDKLFPGVGL